MKKAFRIFRRLLLIILILLILLIGAAVAIPYFFKDELLAKVKEEVNNSLNAKVDFKDVNLSLLRNFPDVSFGLEDLEVIGMGTFEGIPLAKAKEIALRLDIMSVINSLRNNEQAISVKSVLLDQADINILVNKDGSANYDIVKVDSTAVETEETTEVAYEYEVNLNKYAIQNAHFVYHDKTSGIYTEIKGLDHTGKGDFNESVYDLNTETAIEAITVDYGGIAYLNKAKIDLDAILNVNTDNMKFTIKDNDLKVNALRLLAEGFVQLNEEDIEMDIFVNAPGNDFKSVLSLIPYAYIKDYKGVKASGAFSMNAAVKGKYNGETGALPAFNVFLDVQNGSFKYPGLPLGVNEINTKATVNSPDFTMDNYDNLVVDVATLNFKLDEDPFKIKFFLRRPMSDPNFHLDTEGKLDLGNLIKAFPVEGVDQLTGVIESKAYVLAKYSYFESEAYEKIQMEGTVSARDIIYKGPDYPAIAIEKSTVNFSPQTIELLDFEAKLGSSDVSATGNVQNFLAYIRPDKTMEGTLKVRSNVFNADEWMPDYSESEEVVTTSETEESTEGAEVFDQFRFAMDAEIKKLIYGDYDLQNIVAKGSITSNEFLLDNFSIDIGNSDLQANGKAENLFGYAFEQETLKGDFFLKSQNFDLNQFMTEETTAQTTSESEPAATESYEPIEIPANIDFNLTADMANVTYGSMQLRNVKGAVVVKDQKAGLEDVTAEALGGQLAFAGSYDAKNPEKPAFDMMTKVQSLSFPETYNTLNTFQAVAPIGQYINGKFSMDLSMNGLLGKDLMPDFTTFNADGFIETIDAIIKDFKPLGELGNQLNVGQKFNNFSIKDSRNWFHIEDGRVTVEEFDEKVDDIDLKIGGSHLITGGMDYVIKAKVPRKYVEDIPGGEVVGEGLDALTKEASKLGLNINKAEFFNFNIGLTGTLNDPKVKVKLVGTDGESSVKDEVAGSVKEAIDDAKEEATQKVTEEIDKAKEEAQKELDAAKQKAQEEAEKKAEEARLKAEAEKKKAEEEAKRKLEEAQRKAEEEARKAAEEAKKKAEEKLKEWNPFKKKKGGGE